jgi:hypothetical protein
MDIERSLRAHFVERVAAPIPADLTARLASRIEPRRRAGLRWRGRNVALATGSLAAALVAAFVLYEVATVAPTHSGPALATGTPTSTATVAPTPSLPSPSSGLLTHPTGSTDVILSLKIESSGALPIPDSMRALIQETVFVLYGDGTAVFDVSIVRRGGHQTPQDLGLFTVHLDPEQVDQVLRQALDEGRMRDAFHGYPLALIPSTDAVLSIDADGVTQGFVVTAPGSDDPSLDATDRAIRTALGKLVDYLKSFGGSSLVRSIGQASPYRADRYLAVLQDERSVSLSPQFPGNLRFSPWPWPTVSPTAFHTGATSARTLVITPEQYDTLFAVPTTFDLGFAVRGPDGERYMIMARPLLPNERLP